MKTRVLISGPQAPPPGGIASVIDTIVTGELREDFDFERFSTSERRAKLRFLPLRLLNSAVARSLRFDGIAQAETLAKLRAFRRALARRPALVHLHASDGYDFLLAGLFARSAQRQGVPAVLHTHGHYDLRLPTWSRLRRRVFGASLRLPERVIVLAESWRQWFELHAPGARLVVVRNCVDPKRFRPRYERPAASQPVALFVGLSEPRRKGAFDLLEALEPAWRACPELRFVLAGEDVAELAARVRGRPWAERVEFVGRRTAEQMVACYEAADIFLIPSHAEGLPVALLEAMAAGLAVVGTPVNGIPEALGGPEHGRLVEAGDPAALARALVELARDPERRERMGRANRKRVEAEFDAHCFARDLGAVYRAVLEARD